MLSKQSLAACVVWCYVVWCRVWVGVSESGYFVIDLFAERSDGSFFAYPALLLTAVGRLPLDGCMGCCVCVCLSGVAVCVCVCVCKYLRVSNNGTETSIKSARQTHVCIPHQNRAA
mmetsp:Transcript_5070/g.11853  ORF Transcript_5070/g.11853 Transcript_5070/m.11853 type:complete len:116 (-) Transcript_5070:261-608(-)